MQKARNFLLIFLFSFLIVACKNEAKTEANENAAPEVTQKRAKKKVLTEKDIEELNSVMYRIMTTHELKKFASYTVTAELADTLSNHKGPFMVFAPTTQALESLSTEKKTFYSNPQNRPDLQKMLKSHIVEGNMDSQALSQAIASGKRKFKTLAGNTLTVSKSGENMVISDEKGGKATVQKSNIEGSNGMLYVVDGVLSAN